MVKNTLIAFGIAGILIASASVVASPTSALTVDEIQIQIKQLLAKIADLKLQLNSQGSGTVAQADGTYSKHRVCKVLYRNIARGSSGDDVRSLQEFLQSEGYFSANATGYFGPLTAQALAKWQSSQGISSVGAAGPMTRERIKIWCGGPIDNQKFSASPMRGEPPLNVIFSTWISGFRVPNVSYNIEFGDGTSEGATNCYAPADACLSPGQNKHTYTAAGTYVAQLVEINNPCAGIPACAAPISRKVVATIPIHVGAVACTLEYNPVCGAKPIVCITTPCNPIPTTYGNRCAMNADGAVFLYQGACRSDGGNKAPVISGFSGPTTLNVNETGSWTVNAADPENGSLSYQIWWGDENVYAPMSGSAASAREFVQTTTFSHTYSSQGTYTVTIVVRDNLGAEAKMSTTVNVGQSIACTKEYRPVCGQPPEPACRYTPPYCMIPTPAPQTYSNRCMLNAAGATFLYEGQCQTGWACTADAMQCPNGTWVGRTGPNCQFICP